MKGMKGVFFSLFDDISIVPHAQGIDCKIPINSGYSYRKRIAWTLP